MSGTLSQQTASITRAQEKRRHPRLPVCWSTTIRIPGGAPFTTTTTNISLGGIAFQCKMCRHPVEAAGNLPSECPLHRYSTAAENPASITVLLQLPGNANMVTQVYLVHALGTGGSEGHEVGAAFIDMSCADFDRLSSALATIDTD